MKSKNGRLDVFIYMAISLSSCSYVISYPSGAPGFSCSDPVPFHSRRLNTTHVGFYFPQPMAESLYTLETSMSNYINGISVRVTLRAAPGNHFRGFFIQATRALYPLDKEDRPAYGTFRPLDRRDSQTRKCRSAVGQVGGITHTGNRNKTEVTVEYVLPIGCNLGDIQFVATVVKTYSQYWVDVRSDPIRPSGFRGKRTLLCQLYFDPFNQRLQQQVLEVLRTMQMANRNRNLQTGPAGNSGRAQTSGPRTI